MNGGTGSRTDLGGGPSPSHLSEMVDRPMMWRMVLGLFGLSSVTMLLGWLFRQPLNQAAALFVQNFGGLGLFGGVLFTDIWVFPPLANEPLLFFAHAGGMPFWEVWLIAASASWLAGPVGYWLGQRVGRFKSVHRRLEATGLAALIHRRGVWVVLIAGITPIPWAATTWSAGAVGMPFRPFALATTIRVVKVGIYLALIVLGWNVSGLHSISG